MKKLFILFIGLLCTVSSVSAQMIPPAEWSTSVEKISDNTYDLVAIAKIPGEFHMYSQDVKQDGPYGAPLPTVFMFNEDASVFKLIGNTKEGKGVVVKEDPIFKIEIKYFGKQAVFKQRVELVNTSAEITGIVEYMMCDDSRCSTHTEVDLAFKIPEQVSDKITPFDKEDTSHAEVKETPADAHSKTASKKGEKSNSDRSLWAIFILAFGAGFIAIFTPCVFPMIPLTVSFFTKQSKTRASGIKNAVFYAFSIIAIYVLLGTAVTAIFGADALNALASNPWFNLIFFLLLVVFAVSFLGAFEIRLPQSWANKVDAQSNRSGLIGIFFMALALAIVSFSCTGPIVGTLLVEAASKGGMAPIIGMLGFSLAIALPFALFAAFPGWMNTLPKSGGWLNTVKVVLGFLELALAFKFLSNADYVLQLHLFEREVFIAIWITIFGALAFYLFGKIQLPHDSPVTYISVGRLSLGLLVMTFTVYMIPGLWGAPLNLISAFPPPHDYAESPYGVGYTRGGSGGGGHAEALPEGAHLMAPHNIMAFKDYDKGLAYAKEVGKPVMIDFTGYTCVNCRKMEQNVWVKPKVLEVLKNDVVLISLYVDDPKPLPKEEIREYTLKPGKYWKDYGDKWGDLQARKYNANTQPMYVLMDHNEENLNDPVAYTPDVDEYHAWLKDGVSKFKK